MDYKDLEKTIKDETPLPRFPHKKIKQFLQEFNKYKAVKGFQVAAVLVVISAIPLTVFLGQHSQDIRQHAEEGTNDPNAAGNSNYGNTVGGNGQTNNAGDINGGLGNQNPAGTNTSDSMAATEKTMMDQANAKNAEKAKETANNPSTDSGKSTEALSNAVDARKTALDNYNREQSDTNRLALENADNALQDAVHNDSVVNSEANLAASRAQTSGPTTGISQTDATFVQNKTGQTVSTSTVTIVVPPDVKGVTTPQAYTAEVPPPGFRWDDTTGQLVITFP